MISRSISKRTFLKSIGLLAVLGVLGPWFRGTKTKEYPLDVCKDPNSIPRKRI